MSAIDDAFIRAYQTYRTDHLRQDEASPRSRAWSETASHLNAADRLSSSLPKSVQESTAQRRAERRPLSEFARPATAQSQFKPALEVDHFRWSPVCEALIKQHADRLAGLVNALVAADDAGRSLIGIAGIARGAGCTTLTTCAARLLVEAGKTVALVDGSFAAPGLAMHLGLAVNTGWEDVLTGGAPLGEVVVHSLDDKIALLPLVRGGATAAEKLESIHASVTAGVLRYHYDIVLVDLGALGDPNQASTACRLARQFRLDAVILTSGRGQTVSPGAERFARSAPEIANLCLGQVQIAA